MISPEIAREARRNNPHVGDIRDDRYVWNGSAWVEIVEAAVLEEVARALWEADPDYLHRENPQTANVWPPADAYRRLAAAAIAAYRATQDGGAEEAAPRLSSGWAEPLRDAGWNVPQADR